MKEPILTGKALEDFRDWLYKQYQILPENTTHDVHILALIQEWLDSVEIHTNADKHFDSEKWIAIISHRVIREYYFNTRSEALKQAITQANEIYNSTT